MASVTFSSAVPATPGAVAYACTRLGFRVFPLRHDTGTPVFTEWPDKATTDLDQLKSWWTGNYAGCGVGIATGPESGVWVLDIDVKDADGFASLRDLTHRNGDTVNTFTSTMCVRTPSGGAHIYFRWDDASSSEGGIRNSAKHLAPGLDVRGIRGYVRAPGCGAYALIERDGRAVLDLRAAPSWLVPLCKKRRSASAEAMENADVRARLSGDGKRRAKFESAEAVRRLRRAAPGSRNDMLNTTAFRLGTLAGLYGEPTRADAQAWCLGALVSAGANDTAEQQMRTFNSGWESGIAKAMERQTNVADHRMIPET